MNLNLFGRLLICCLVLPFCLGCGGSAPTGPARFDLSGKVTFDGKPVPSGRIDFEPDSEQQNSGPAGFAEIKNGSFSTSGSGKGTVGGPHIVRIQGFDGAGAERKPLFQEYSLKESLPKSASTKDFSVPASAAENMATDNAPPP